MRLRDLVLCLIGIVVMAADNRRHERIRQERERRTLH